MWPSTAVGLALIIGAVLPGSVYTWAYEREASAFGVTLADRTLRFITVSVIFHLVLAWPEYGLWRLALAHRSVRPVGQFAAVWSATLLLVAVPAVVGTVLGGLYATRTGRTGWRLVRGRLGPEAEARLLRFVLGRTPAPRAWDNLFSERPNVYLRVRLVNDTWIAGRFARGSYAGGFPHDTDLLLEEAWGVDQDSGMLVGDTGLGTPVYIAAGQIRWMEIVSEQGDDEGQVTDGG